MCCYSHAKATAHIIIKSRIDSTDKIIEYLKRITNVKDVHKTFGEYDILAKVEADSSESLGRIIRWEISPVEGIYSVVVLACMRNSTCVVVE